MVVIWFWFLDALLHVGLVGYLVFPEEVFSPLVVVVTV
jgi:hypothetical protein